MQQEISDYSQEYAAILQAEKLINEMRNKLNSSPSRNDLIDKFLRSRSDRLQQLIGKTWGSAKPPEWIVLLSQLISTNEGEHKFLAQYEPISGYLVIKILFRKRGELPKFVSNSESPNLTKEVASAVAIAACMGWFEQFKNSANELSELEAA